MCVCVCALSHICAGAHPHVYMGQRSTLVVCFHSSLPFRLFLTHWPWSYLIGWLDWLTTSAPQGSCCLYLPRVGIIGTHIMLSFLTWVPGITTRLWHLHNNHFARQAVPPVAESFSSLFAFSQLWGAKLKSLLGRQLLWHWATSPVNK